MPTNTCYIRVMKVPDFQTLKLQNMHIKKNSRNISGLKIISLGLMALQLISIADISALKKEISDLKNKEQEDFDIPTDIFAENWSKEEDKE